MQLIESTNTEERKKRMKLEINKIHNEECLSGLKKLADDSVDMCVTSPPYYNLRDYKNIKQIGIENSVDGFVSNLCDIFDEVKRVLKNEGVCWVNIGDTYRNKALLQVPSRFELEMVKRGWHLRNEIIWSKPNPQPISSKDRFWTNHEKFFMFVKNPKKYYFDQPRVPQAEISIRRMFSKNHVDKRKDKDTTEKEGFALSSKNQDNHYARMRENLNISKDFNYEELIKSGNVPTRPKFTVWDISSKGYKGAHFAVYPEELISDPITSSCPIGGIVLDPFCGSGTSAIVALKNERNFIGFEINEEYLELANTRISKEMEQQRSASK
jgi:DNA modification methylase